MSAARGEFLTDIETLRRRAREHIDEGAALTRGYSMANGIHAQAAAAEFLERVDLLATPDPTQPA